MTHESNTSHGSCRSHTSYVLWVLTPILLAGCGIGSERKHPLELRVAELQQEKTDLAGKLEQCQVKNEQLQQQAQALIALPEGNRENPYKLTNVRISGFTGFYDTEATGRREKLLVYLQPIDETGDIIKAAGTVTVQLWNLNKPADQALLGQWQVPPSELRKLWVSALVSSYRLPFDAPVTAELLTQPLTAKVTFTDYLTGQTFSNQHVIKPRLE